MSDSLRIVLKLIKVANPIFLVNIFVLGSAAAIGVELPRRPYIVWWGRAKTVNNVTIVSAMQTADIKYWRN